MSGWWLSVGVIMLYKTLCGGYASSQSASVFSSRTLAVDVFCSNFGRSCHDLFRHLLLLFSRLVILRSVVRFWSLAAGYHFIGTDGVLQMYFDNMETRWVQWHILLQWWTVETAACLRQSSTARRSESTISITTAGLTLIVTLLLIGMVLLFLIGQPHAFRCWNAHVQWLWNSRLINCSWSKFMNCWIIIIIIIIII